VASRGLSQAARSRGRRGWCCHRHTELREVYPGSEWRWCLSEAVFRQPSVNASLSPLERISKAGSRPGGERIASALVSTYDAALFPSPPALGPFGLATVYSRAGSNPRQREPTRAACRSAVQRRPLWRERCAGSIPARRTCILDRSGLTHPELVEQHAPLRAVLVVADAA
jgi:hypothetical protein